MYFNQTNLRKCPAKVFIFSLFSHFWALTHYNFQNYVLTTFSFTSMINCKCILYFHGKELEQKHYLCIWKQNFQHVVEVPHIGIPGMRFKNT